MGVRVPQLDAGSRITRGPYNEGMVRVLTSTALLAFVVLVHTAAAQPVPQPFPRPAAPQQAEPPSGPPAAPATPAAPPPGQNPSSTPGSTAPTEAQLGVTIYPSAQFIASFDAGQNQRYYLFGVNAPYADIVAYYRTVLKNRGDVVFDEPPVHIFETGRFREESMVFPPSVAVKDYTWGGLQGYLVPLPGGKSQRYPTIIQIVPVSPAAVR